MSRSAKVILSTGSKAEVLGANCDPLAWIDEELAALERQGLLRKLSTYEGPQDVVLDAGGHHLVNFGSNDYLGLAADARLRGAVATAIAQEGCGAGSSPLVTGHSAAHQRLEQALAEFEGAEAALVFSSGFAANVGTIAALVGREDVIFADEHNHASMIDGCRLSRAEVQVYPHGDWRALESLLAANRSAGRRLIATESVFSMHGDLAPLTELAALAERFECMLLVDEAHATGVLGPQGRGLCEHLEIEQAVHVRIGTLSKALGGAGGFVVGSRSLVDWLVNRARTFIFSTALPPVICEAGLAALEIVKSEPGRRINLQSQAAALRSQLRQRGWNVGQSASQIIPLVVGDPQTALHYSARLREQGLLVPAMRPPSVPGGESLLRISLSAAHTPPMIEQLLAALGNCEGISGALE